MAEQHEKAAQAFHNAYFESFKRRLADDPEAELVADAPLNHNWATAYEAHKQAAIDAIVKLEADGLIALI